MKRFQWVQSPHRRAGAAHQRAARAVTIVTIASLLAVLVPSVPARGATGGPGSCPTSTVCVAVDATVALGPEAHPAQGLLNGVDQQTPSGLIQPLHPGLWRVSNPAAFQAARQAGAAVVEILSDLWYQHTATHPGGGATAPWRDWGAYGRWVVQTVGAARAAGRAPDYWEVQNEPGDPGYYLGGGRPAVADLLEQLAVAYRAIKTADPGAKVIGPSLALFRDRPSGSGVDLDLGTFLDFADRRQLVFDAVAWHELLVHPGPGGDPAWWVTSPAAIVAHAREARRLLARHPGLGHPLLFVGEYGPYTQHLVPGWTVGYLAALEAARVDGANRSCWASADVVGTKHSECAAGLDGLLDPGQQLPTPSYWVHAFYAAMTGRRVGATTSKGNVSALATDDAASRRVSVLIGRHVSCVAANHPACDERPAATPEPVELALDVRIPGRGVSTVTVAVRRIADSAVQTAAPTAGFTGVVAVLNGRMHLELGQVSDGDAYAVTVSA